MAYEVLDISGDAGIRSCGAGFEEALAEAAVGMFSLITDVGQVREVRSINVHASADTPEALVVGLLNDMIFHFDTYGFIGRRVEVCDRDRSSIRARVYGEEFDAERHESRLLVKAATFHDIKVADAGDHWEIEVVFDI